MKVVLRRNVPGLGQAGDVKDVADGYGRNYLIPRGFAVIATSGVVANAEARKAAERRQLERLDEERRALAQQIDGSSVVVRARAGSQGRLHGSITPAQIAEALGAVVGKSVDRHEIEIADPIRQLGEHTVLVRLAPRVAAKLTVVVEREE